MSEPSRLTPGSLERLARERARLVLEPEARESLLRRLQQLEAEVRSFEPLVGLESEPLWSPNSEGE